MVRPELFLSRCVAIFFFARSTYQLEEPPKSIFVALGRLYSRQVVEQFKVVGSGERLREGRNAAQIAFRFQLDEIHFIGLFDAADFARWIAPATRPIVPRHVPAHRIAAQGRAVHEGLAARLATNAAPMRSRSASPIADRKRSRASSCRTLTAPGRTPPTRSVSCSAVDRTGGTYFMAAVVAAFAVVLAQNGDDPLVEQPRHENSTLCPCRTRLTTKPVKSDPAGSFSSNVPINPVQPAVLPSQQICRARDRSALRCGGDACFGSCLLVNEQRLPRSNCSRKLPVEERRPNTSGLHPACSVRCSVNVR